MRDDRLTVADDELVVARLEDRPLAALDRHVDRRSAGQLWAAVVHREHLHARTHPLA